MSETWLIDARHLRPAALDPPLSKSDAQRALVLERILNCETNVSAPLVTRGLIETSTPVHPERSRRMPGTPKERRFPQSSFDCAQDERGELTSLKPMSAVDGRRDSGGARTAPAWLTLPDLASQPNDVQILARGLAALDSSSDSISIDAEDGGAPFRILLGQAAITSKETIFSGTPRLAERPHQALLDSLQRTLGRSGFSFEWRKPWPLIIRGCENALEPTFRVRAEESSQFVTSLMLAAAALSRREARAWIVALDGVPASAAYLDITLSWLARAGFEARRAGAEASWTISWTRPSMPATVPGDWSSIGYLLLAAWKSGGDVTAVDETAEHPDARVLSVLRASGLRVEISAGSARVFGALARGIEASGEDCPDLLPTLAALACVCPAPSVLSYVEILRAKESDRLTGIRELVAAAGGSTTLTAGRLEITPPVTRPELLRCDSRGDHRLAMAAATLAVLFQTRLSLTEPQCVKKSFPGFWTQLERVGVAIQGRSAT